jgi:hypothetical protein
MEDSLLRSVGRRNGHRGFWARVLRRKADGIRRGHADVDFHDRGDDVWKALRY